MKSGRERSDHKNISPWPGPAPAGRHPAMFREDVDPLIYMEEKGMTMVTDAGTVEKVVEQVLTDNPKTVEEYHSGKTKVLGFLVGQVMRQMKGKADPGQVNRMLLERL